MKALRFAKHKAEWLLKYDEANRTVTVEGPSPTAAEIHQWISSPQTVVDASGAMVRRVPTESWPLLIQAIDLHMYAHMELVALVE